MAETGQGINTTSIELPKSVSKEIIQKMQEDSAVMTLARKIDLPGNGATIPEILSDPEPEWVSETNQKPVSKPGLGTKDIKGYTLAVIVPFSNQFKRNNPALYNALVGRLPRALGAKFDNTVFGGTQAPGSNFDTFADVTGIDITSNTYAGLVTADTNIAIAGGILNGYAISPQAKGILLTATDENGRPLFINSVAEGAIPMILGSRTKLTRGAFVEGVAVDEDVQGDTGTPATVGVAGDWTQAVYGVVEGVSISISDQATITINNAAINLWERNMFAVRAEIEIGFRANTDVFCRLLGAVPTE
jgi:HK97 family phage major capsid protein